MDMVRQLSQSCGFYTAKVAKATETPSEPGTQVLKSPGERLPSRLRSNPTTTGASAGFEDAAASKGPDSDLNPSVRGIYCERGNC